jgi:hypothetical protein
LGIWQIAMIVPDRMMTATVGLLVFGMIALMVMCVVPPDARLIPLVVGVAGLRGSRGLLEIRARKLQKPGPGSPLPADPSVGLAVGVSLSAVVAALPTVAALVCR